MSEHLWESARELCESEARSLTPSQVQIRTVNKLREVTNRDKHYELMWRKGWKLKHITQMEKGSYTEYYEFFWVNPRQV